MSTPKHYKKQNPDFEPRKVIEAICEDSFYIANALKYISRAGKKDNIIKDLRKAIDYLNYKHNLGNSKQLVDKTVSFETEDSLTIVHYNAESVAKEWNLSYNLSKSVYHIFCNELDAAIQYIDNEIFIIKNKNIFTKMYYLFA